MQQVRILDKKKTKRGDSIIEVMLAITIFSVVAVSTLSLMNSGVNVAQRTLETSMARDAIEGQAEALRFIHNNYVAEMSGSSSGDTFTKLWTQITDIAAQNDNASTSASFNIENLAPATACKTAISSDHSKKFILNPRALNGYNGGNIDTSSTSTNPVIVKDTSATSADNWKIREASLYPRLFYSTGGTSYDEELSDSSTNSPKLRLIKSEGLWITAVRNTETSGLTHTSTKSTDFYIRTCWYPSGSRTPATLTSIVRLYAPRSDV